MAERCLFYIGCLLSIPIGAAEAQSVEDQINEALLASPEALRDDATVIVRDAQGSPTIIRLGTNVLVCEPDRPGGGFPRMCWPDRT